MGFQSAYTCKSPPPQPSPPPIECGGDSYLFKGECVTTCPEGRVATTGTGNSGNTCQDCATNCAECLEGTTTCEKCDYGTNLVNGACQSP